MPRHLSEFTDQFIQVVRLAREIGLVKLGTIAVDGAKIKANASRHKAMSYARMQTSETDLDIPAELERRQARLAAITTVKDRLEQR